MKSLYLSIFLAFLSCGIVLGQDIPKLVTQAYAFVNEKKYKEALKVLRDVDERYVEISEDSCAMMFFYTKGSSLYFLDRFEDAIPYLNKALLRMEKFPHEDCIYLELIYGIGSCYNKLKQYHNAEKYFRRVIIRGNVLRFKCGITTQALSELTGVYNKLGFTKLAKECAAKIDTEIDNLPSENWSNRVEGLFDLAESYDEQGKYDEEIKTYHKILDLIESNVGKTNDDYLLYASVFRYKLLSQNRQEEAIEILKEMIDVGQSYKVHNEIICSAYQDYLEIMAKQNETELVEKILPEAVEYIQQTDKKDWQEYNLYERIGNAFAEIGNYSYGAKYLEMPWNGMLPNNLRSFGNLGICYYNVDPQKSLDFYKKAESLINDSTNSLTKKVLYFDMYSLYSKMQQYDEAIKYAKLVAPYLKEIDGNEVYAKYLILWAVDCVNAHQFHKAQKLFEEAKNLFSVISDNVKVTYYSQYGFYLMKTNDSSRAIGILKNGIKLCVESLGKDHEFLINMYHNLGRAYMLQQDYANALLYLNKSKDLQIKLNGKSIQRTLDYIKECESK